MKTGKKLSWMTCTPITVAALFVVVGANWKGFTVGSLTLYLAMLLAISFLLGRCGSGGPGILAYPLWMSN